MCNYFLISYFVPDLLLFCFRLISIYFIPLNQGWIMNELVQLPTCHSSASIRKNSTNFAAETDIRVSSAMILLVPLKSESSESSSSYLPSRPPNHIDVDINMLTISLLEWLFNFPSRVPFMAARSIQSTVCVESSSQRL